MNRIFDLIAVIGVAVVVLLPKASVDARPALSGDPGDLARVAQLEETLSRTPDDEATAVALAELYLRLEHPDWALVTLSRFDGRSASAKLSLLRATAHAERLSPGPALAASRDGNAACETRGCPPDIAARLSVIAAPMQALVDQGIDPTRDPQKAKEAVGKVLHSTRPAKPATK